MFARILLLAAVLMGGASSTPAKAQPAAGYVLQGAGTWAEALAVCDLTRFLLEQRNLNADVILARDRTGQFTPFYGPRFQPPNLLYDEAVHRAFFRLERAGEVTRAGVKQARFERDRSMLRAFRRMRPAERRVLEEQSTTCSALFRDVRTRYP